MDQLGEVQLSMDGLLEIETQFHLLRGMHKHLCPLRVGQWATWATRSRSFCMANPLVSQSV